MREKERDTDRDREEGGRGRVRIDIYREIDTHKQRREEEKVQRKRVKSMDRQGEKV